MGRLSSLDKAKEKHYEGFFRLLSNGLDHQALLTSYPKESDSGTQLRRNSQVNSKITELGDAQQKDFIQVQRQA